ncbi:hypothetical protein QE152_g35300 [Popillia japonica]|uniref:Uncharacterized protein n=1 Tax=Popillia japonica TaxID=7064 RepID=A0AAW1IFP3_POPJA
MGELATSGITLLCPDTKSYPFGNLKPLLQEEPWGFLRKRMPLANDLVIVSKHIQGKRGRPSTASVKSPIPRNKDELGPSDDVKFDGIDHFPEHDQ